MKPLIIEEFGYILNNYKVIKDTIRSGENFGEILDRHHIDYPEIYKIATAARDTFDIRKLRAGKPYTILAKNDSTERAQVFIYQPNKVEYLIVDFTDSVQTKFGRKEVKIVEKINKKGEEMIKRSNIDRRVIERRKQSIPIVFNRRILSKRRTGEDRRN